MGVEGRGGEARAGGGGKGDFVVVRYVVVFGCCGCCGVEMGCSYSCAIIVICRRGDSIPLLLFRLGGSLVSCLCIEGIGSIFRMEGLTSFSLSLS